MVVDMSSRLEDFEMDGAGCRVTGEDFLVRGGGVNHHGRMTGSCARRGPKWRVLPHTQERVC